MSALDKFMEPFAPLLQEGFKERLHELHCANRSVNLKELTEFAALREIIREDIWGPVRKNYCMLLEECYRETLEKLEPVSTVENTYCTNSLFRDHPELYTKTADLFQDRLIDKHSAHLDYMDGDSIRHLHPYVQWRLLDNEVDRALSAFVTVPTTTTQGDVVLNAVRDHLFPKDFASIKNGEVRQIVISAVANVETEEQKGFTWTGNIVLDPKGHCETFVNQ